MGKRLILCEWRRRGINFIKSEKLLLFFIPSQCRRLVGHCEWWNGIKSSSRMRKVSDRRSCEKVFKLQLELKDLLKEYLGKMKENEDSIAACIEKFFAFRRENRKLRTNEAFLEWKDFAKWADRVLITMILYQPRGVTGWWCGAQWNLIHCIIRNCSHFTHSSIT